jgi:hypothetical protein
MFVIVERPRSFVIDFILQQYAFLPRQEGNVNSVLFCCLGSFLLLMQTPNTLCLSISYPWCCYFHRVRDWQHSNWIL